MPVAMSHPASTSATGLVNRLHPTTPHLLDPPIDGRRTRRFVRVLVLNYGGMT